MKQTNAVERYGTRADLPVDDPRHDTASAAAFLGVEPKTLQKWRVLGIGPQYFKVGNGKFAAVRYLESSLRDFITVVETRPIESNH